MIEAARILLPGGTWSGAARVRLDAGRIAAIEPAAAATGTLTSGLIDLHNNGAAGIDFADATGAEWVTLRGTLARHGVTAVQPTIITAPLPGLRAALDRVAAAMSDETPGAARLLGAHLEGPFLSPVRRGAHRLGWLALPAADAVDALRHHPALRTVTLAPELDGGTDAIRRFREAGILVSLGHSDATAAQAAAAADAGATLVTHLFNAMHALFHREPGLPGAALTDPRLHPCLIADGQHVHPTACRLAFAAAAARVILVTDSILAAGLPPGTRLPFGGEPVEVDPTGLCRRLDGTIAGAGIFLDEGVRRMVAAGIDPAAVLRSATETPADAVGRPDLGRIAPGAAADLILWDDDWHPRRVWIAGREIT